MTVRVGLVDDNADQIDSSNQSLINKKLVDFNSPDLLAMQLFVAMKT